MNRTLAVVAALAAGFSTLLLPGSAMGQTAAPAAPAAAAAPAPPPPPQAVPAKIALIFFDQAVGATNEGQKAGVDLQKKYDPQRQKISSEAQEVDGLKKQLDSAGTTISDAERAKRLQVIDTKEKQYNLDGQDAQAAYQADLQDVFGKIAPKVMAVAEAYCDRNDFTILLDAGNQQSNIMWVTGKVNVNITEAVIDAYNTSSGIAPPPPAAPSAARRPSSTAPAATHPAAKPPTTTK